MYEITKEEQRLNPNPYQIKAPVILRGTGLITQRKGETYTKSK